MSRTDVGRDWQADIMGGGQIAGAGTGEMAPADWMALSANTDAENPANTTLPGEIGSGTLARVQAAYAHTDGQATYTLTNIFTSDQTVTIAKVGIFNAATAGIFVFEKLLADPAPMISGDQVVITATVTL